MPYGSRIWIAAASGAMSAQSAAAQTNVSFICSALDRNSGELTVKVDTGCMTGMARYKDNDLELAVDQQRATIKVSGSIEYFPITSPIVTHDCAGATQISLSASGIEARRYSVNYNGEWLGVADLLESPQFDSCMNAVRRSSATEFKHVNRQSFDDWSDDPVHGWSEWRGENAFSLVSPLLSDHPETDEGRPQVDIRVEKRIWNMQWPHRDKLWKSEPFVAVWITRHGLLDDSISGDRYFAELRRDGDGWRIEELFGQHMCARGETAGQWTAERCP